MWKNTRQTSFTSWSVLKFSIKGKYIITVKQFQYCNRQLKIYFCNRIPYRKCRWNFRSFLVWAVPDTFHSYIASIDYTIVCQFFFCFSWINGKTTLRLGGNHLWHAWQYQFLWESLLSVYRIGIRYSYVADYRALIFLLNFLAKEEFSHAFHIMDDCGGFKTSKYSFNMPYCYVRHSRAYLNSEIFSDSYISYFFILLYIIYY